MVARRIPLWGKILPFIAIEERLLPSISCVRNGMEFSVDQCKGFPRKRDPITESNAIKEFPRVKTTRKSNLENYSHARDC